MTSAIFGIGQLVQHRRFGYRGVVFDVDPTFQASAAWYEQMATSRPPKDRPWYHVLVHGADHTTYVAERNLEPDADGGAVDHPLLWTVFARFESHAYVPKAGLN